MENFCWTTIAYASELFGLLPESILWLTYVGQLQTKTVGEFQLVNVAPLFRRSPPEIREMTSI